MVDDDEEGEEEEEGAVLGASKRQRAREIYDCPHAIDSLDPQSFRGAAAARPRAAKPRAAKGRRGGALAAVPPIPLQSSVADLRAATTKLAAELAALRGVQVVNVDGVADPNDVEDPEDVMAAWMRSKGSTGTTLKSMFSLERLNHPDVAAFVRANPDCSVDEVNGSFCAR